MRIRVVAVVCGIVSFGVCGAARAQKWESCSVHVEQSPHGTAQPQTGQDDKHSAGFDQGYVDGIEVGGRDRQKGKSARPDRYDWYKSGDRCYKKDYGDKNVYKSEYRKGFEQGYTEANGRTERSN